MLQIVLSNQFRKDLKLSKKWNQKIEKLREVVDILSSQKSLDKKYKDHCLSGDYSGFRECHIEDDWILIYIIKDDLLYLFRTGTHSDLF